MNHELVVKLESILDAIAVIEQSIEGISFDDYHTDRQKRILAVEQFGLITSTMRQMPDEFKTGHPEIDWGEFAGLWERFLHHDFGINEQEIWKASKKTIKALQKQIDILLDGQKQ